MAPLNVLTLGGSRNIGYFSSVRLLDAGCTVTFLLRSPSIFDNNETIQKYVKSGKAFLFKGDGLVQEDVKHAWEEAISHSPEGKVDFLLSTVGGKPSFELLRGAVVKPENLVTQCFLNAITTVPSSVKPSLKIVTISSTGLTRTSHASLPLLMKPMYSYLLDVPHKDKIGVERVVSHACDWEWNPADGEPEENILPKGWQGLPGMPAKGSLKNSILVVRPSMLTDGECLAEKNVGKKGNKPPYRVQDVKEGQLSGYTVSRKDVGHFVAQAILASWDEYKGKCVVITY